MSVASITESSGRSLLLSRYDTETCFWVNTLAALI